MRKNLITITLIALSGLIYLIPGKYFVQFGLRKMAFENGIEQASKMWYFEATPELVELDTPTAKPKKLARR